MNLSEPLSESSSVHEIPFSRLRALLRDFTNLLGQQMYFWGRDVMHPQGNLLCDYGFEKRKSGGLKGTSCYRKKLDEGGFVELHGACAGHYDPSKESDSGFLYIRNRKRCFLYTGSEPPAPGIYAPDTLKHGSASDHYFASLRFLSWWLDYERWIAKNTSATWRKSNFKAFANLPSSRPLLSPQEAPIWLSQYRSTPSTIPRLREQMRSLNS